MRESRVVRWSREIVAHVRDCDADYGRRMSKPRSDVCSRSERSAPLPCQQLQSQCIIFVIDNVDYRMPTGCLHMCPCLRPSVSKMNYTVSSGTLNPSIPYHAYVGKQTESCG